jgi:hypothetical protein
MTALMVMNSISVAKLGFEQPFIGPEPACGISMGVAKKVVKDWTNRGHRGHWDPFSGFKQAKAPLQGPSCNKIKELLKLNGNQLGWVVALLTGHCHLKKTHLQIRISKQSH